jgi:hypothetical protein
MEPTTIALIASASTLSALGGVVLGRMSARGRAEQPEAPAVTPQVNPAPLRRLEELEGENAALREALDMGWGDGVTSGPLSAQLERLEAALRELRSRKFTRAAAVFDAGGVALCQRGEEDAVGVLGALAGALTSFGAPVDALEWSGQRGEHLWVERVDAGGHALVLGVWTDGQRAARSATSVARGILTGRVEPATDHEPRASIRVGEDAPSVLEELASELPLDRLAITRGADELLAFGEPLDEERGADLYAMWRWARALGEARGVVGLGSLSRLHVHARRQRVSAYRVPEREHALWLTMSAAAPTPDARIEGWLGRLRFQLDDAPTTPDPTPDHRLPETHRGVQP